MTPDPTAITMAEAAADEAVEFWSKVPTHLAYWDGYKQCVKDVARVGSLMEIPGFRHLAQMRYRWAMDEISKLKHTIIELKLENNKLAVLASQQSIRATVLEWIEAQEGAWTWKDMYAALPDIKDTTIRTWIGRFRVDGVIQRCGTTHDSFGLYKLTRKKRGGKRPKRHQAGVGQAIVRPVGHGARGHDGGTSRCQVGASGDREGLARSVDGDLARRSRRGRAFNPTASARTC